MAPPASKRRKTDHVSSSDKEGDDASFASFGSDESEEEQASGRAGEGIAVHGAELDGEVDSADDQADEEESGDVGRDDEDSDDDDDNEQAVVTAVVATSKPPKATHDTRRKSDGKDSLGESAYASGTFKSNVFKLQVDELLGQIRPRQGQRERDAETALHQLKKSIEHIPPRGPFTVNDAERDLIKEKVAIPFPEPRPPKDAKFKFSYAQPTNINVVGSYALKTSSRSRDSVHLDMVVTLPDSLFEDKDFVNFRYFYKRAYYLACMAAGLQESHKQDFKIEFRLMHGDVLKPVLAVSPLQRLELAAVPVGPKWRINIIPCLSQTRFNADKLRPDRNCVRNSHKAEENSATPFYNSSLRADMLCTAYLKLLHASSKVCEAFKDACLLGSTWLRQRGFASSIERGGFGSFEWSALVALCLQGGGPSGKPLLSGGYSSYQLFKATLQLLAMKDFTKQPFVTGKTSDRPQIGDSPLVWDGERSHNLLFKTGHWAYRSLRQEARLTLNALGDQLNDGFDATFILRLQESLFRHDVVAMLPLRLLSRKAVRADHHGQQHVQYLYDTLKRGLGDRVTHIHINASQAANWNLGSARPDLASKGIVTVGLSINPDHSRRAVDRGPAAEQKHDAAEFRKFWGDKAELRRFNDGSIVESLVWQSPAESGHSVTEQIVRYLLAHHFGAVTTEDLQFFDDGFGKLVNGGNDIATFKQIIQRYDQFQTDIRSLSDLPLSIREIMPADAQLCYSSIRAPVNDKGRPTPADVTIQFEGSGRWPDDLVAIQRTKIAFLLKINELLQNSVDSVETRMGLENQDQEVLNQAFLDVTYGTEATFRLRVYHDREQTLHERQLKNKSTDPRSREIAAVGLARYKRDYLRKPAQINAIKRLCESLPALSGSIRLAKKWFASHLLINHISEEVIELLVVRTFTQPHPWQTPSSIQTGFLRTLLWISRWDWRAEPLVVDLSASGQLKQADMHIIQTNFEAWRKLDPSMNHISLFAASNLDHDGSTWTDGAPAKVIAGRMTTLAKAACAEITSKQLALEPTSLFSSPLSDFDFILHLNPAHTGKNSPKSSTVFKNLELESLTDSSLIGYDPIRFFLSELEETYGSAILFFYGGKERNVIAGLWSPLTARRGWKVNLAYSTIPVKGKGKEADTQANLNKSGILAEIARIGGDLVSKVEIQEK